MLEAQPEIGGGARLAQLFPGYVSDLFSAFYPMVAASPVMRALGLEDHGLRWAHAPTVPAHPASPVDERGAVLHRDPAGTAAGLAVAAPRDGATWLRLVAQWRKIRDPLLAGLFTTFPPVRGRLGLLARIGTGEALRLARFLALPAHRMAGELFHAEPGRLLITGLAMHADVPPDAPGSGLLGWLLAMLAQDGGFPVPVGGAGQLSTALAVRARAGERGSAWVTRSSASGARWPGGGGAHRGRAGVAGAAGRGRRRVRAVSLRLSAARRGGARPAA